MSKIPTARRPSFSAGVMSNLRAAAGEGQGEPLSLLLSEIDEDPDQPRRRFDDGELASLADSIRERGVVQPIVVRPPADGRYVLAFGARRYRAAKLAGLKSIPAVVRARGADGFAEQLIENQQRSNLSNRELAEAIERLAASGKTNKQIAVFCALKDYQVAAFRAVGKFPDILRDRLDGSDVRALYDLHRQYTKTPEPIAAALEGASDTLTITDARRILESVTGKSSGSIVLERRRQDADASEPASSDAADDTPQPGGEATDNVAETAPNTPAEGAAKTIEDLHGASVVTETVTKRRTRGGSDSPAQPAVAALPVFLVKSGGGDEIGRLVTDRRAEAPGWALVAFAAGVEEVALDDLRIVRIE